jgi:hypothetical protein
MARSRRDSDHDMVVNDRPGWLSFCTWAEAVALLTLAVLGAFSIGILVMPFGLVFLWLAVRRTHAWPEWVMGGPLGLGATLLLIAYLNRGYVPCIPSGTMSRSQGAHSCGGHDPAPWLAIGAILVIAGITGFSAARRTRQSS